MLIGNRSLSDKDQLQVNTILKNYEKQIHAIHASSTADFTSEEQVASGILMIHPPSAKIHVDSLPINAFTYLAICPILNVKGRVYTDEDFKNVQLLQTAVPQYADQPANLKFKDNKPWKAELGEDENAFAGVFKQTKGRNTRYYVAAQAGAPLACRQLREKIIKNKMTFEQLLLDPDYSYAHYLAQRNVQRLAFNVARAMKVPIRHMEDVSAYAENEFSGRPMRAMPQYLQPISTIQPVNYEGISAIGVFNKLSPIKEKVHFVYQGPFAGIAMLNVPHVSGQALPSTTGRVIVGELSKSPLPKDGLVWEKGGSENHEQLHPQAFADIEEEHILGELKEMGWKPEQISTLIPIAVKIFTSEIKRK
jgi:hypothetical protein